MHKTILGVITATLLATSAFAGEMVVVDVRKTTAYTLGQTIDETAKVTLAANERISVITPSGETIIVPGPFAGQVKQSPTTNNEVVAGLSNIVKSKETNTATLGTVRGTNNTVTLPNPWYLAVNTATVYCYNQKQNPITFYRVEAKNPISFSIEPSSRNWEARGTMASGQNTFVVKNENTNVDFGNNVAYTITMGTEQKNITFVRIPDLTTAATISYMEAMGCRLQADALVKTVK